MPRKANPNRKQTNRGPGRGGTIPPNARPLPTPGPGAQSQRTDLSALPGPNPQAIAAPPGLEHGARSQLEAMQSSVPLPGATPIPTGGGAGPSAGAQSRVGSPAPVPGSPLVDLAAPTTRPSEPITSALTQRQPSIASTAETVRFLESVFQSSGQVDASVWRMYLNLRKQSGQSPAPLPLPTEPIEAWQIPHHLGG